MYRRELPTAGITGTLGLAARFDGTDDVIAVTDTLSLRNPQFTVSLWFQWDGMGTDQVNFLTAKGLAHMELHTGGGTGVNGLRFIPAGGSTMVDAANVIQSGWNHVAATYDGSTANLYINGVLAASRPGIVGGDNLTTDSVPFSVGRCSDGTYPFAGVIDEVRMYNRVLSPVEVARLANAFKLTPTAGAHGSITPATAQTVAFGSSLTFTIAPDTGYHILDVGVDGVSQGAIGSYTFSNVTANHTITATFAITTYTLTVATAGNGSGVVMPSIGTHTHPYGALVPITAAADAGSTFTGWSGDATGSASPVTVTMIANQAVTATFNLISPITVIHPISCTGITTFGAANVGLMCDANYTDPGVITVTKSTDWTTPPTTGILVKWDITPTVTSGFSLTLQLCYTADELHGLNENDLRFWRSEGGTYTQLITVPVLSTVNGLRCATLSGITALSRWTLATTSGPTVVTFNHLSAASRPSADVERRLKSALLLLPVAFVVAGWAGLMWRRKSARN